MKRTFALLSLLATVAWCDTHHQLDPKLDILAKEDGDVSSEHGIAEVGHGDSNSPYSSIIATGSGLRRGKVNEYSIFQVYGVGSGDLLVKIRGPMNPDILIQTNSDLSKKVSWLPTVAGKYVISVKVDGSSILDSPFNAIIHSQAGEELPTENVRPTQSGVVCYGKGLEQGVVDMWNEVVVDTTKDKYGRAKVVVRGPRGGPSTRIDVRETGFHNDIIRFFYRVGRPGSYQVEILYNGSPVRGSPFRVDVVEDMGARIGDRDTRPEVRPDSHEVVPEEPRVIPEVSRPDETETGTDLIVAGPDVRLSGTGLLEGLVDQWNEIIADCTRAGPGSLSVVMSGPVKVEWQSQQLSAARFRYYYRTRVAGAYVLEVEYNGRKLSESPFKVLVKQPGGTPNRVTDDETTSGGYGEVKASGRGIVRPLVSQWNEIRLDTNNSPPGKLTVSISGPGKVHWNKSPFENGVITYSYKTYVSGDYEILIQLDGKNIPGSPFKVHVLKLLSAAALMGTI